MTRRRLFFSILLFLIYELIIWLGSYYLAADNFLLAGLMLTALGLTVLIVYILVARLAKRMAAPPPAPASGGDAAGQPAPAATAIPSGPDPELDAVVAQIAEANARLAQSPKLASRRVKTGLADLPMYILAGPEGTGKTTTFLKAGLEPELLAGQVYRDATVLPTRLCNFWYTGEAVFVEASGNLFSSDAGRWARLLQKLRGKKGGSLFRKLIPGKAPKPGNIRGIVLFVDVAPFTGMPDPNRITGLARRLQERLRAAGESFGNNYPVYVLFTKSDAIPYFTEYFGRITDSEDQQVFGCTLKADASRPAGEVYAEAEVRRLTEAFNNLYYSLADKRVLFLARENQPQERAATYEFPREMKRIRDTLIQFLVDAFRPNPLQPGAILRGFYFTGTRKASASLASEGESARRFSSAGEATSFFNLQEYQAKMGMAPAQPRSSEQTIDRWCFVSELFHRVILADNIAKSTSFSDRRLDLYRRIAYGGVAAVAILLSLAFIGSWMGNRDLVHQSEDAVKLTYDYQPASHGTPSLNSLRSMDAIRQQLATLQEYKQDGPPLHLRWGLYSGERVRPTLYKLYFQRFREIFFDDFHNALSADLAGLPAAPDAGAHPFNTVYDRLKAYRMITSCKCTPDKAFLAPVVFGLWNTNRSLDPERQELAFRQVDFYADQLRHKNPYLVDEKQEIVDHSRQYLSAFQGAERIYRGMLAAANQTPRQPARVADIAPNFRQALTGPGEVDAAFTKDGWDYMQQALKQGNRGSVGEPCVLGAMGFASQAMGEGSEIASQIRNLYLRDYIDKWEQFLSQTGVEPFRNAGDAAKKLGILADNRSPLLAALYLASENTNYSTAPKNAAPAAPKKPSGILQVLKRKFEPAKARQAEQLAREANLKMPAPGAAAANQPPPGDMSQIFQPVRQVAPPGSKDRLIDAPNQKYMDALNAMQRAMDRISNDHSSTPDMTLHQAAAQAADAGQDAVRQMAAKFNIAGTEGVDESVKKMLEQPFQYAMRFVITDASKIGKDKAGAAAKSFCARLAGLQRKFPFNAQSDTEVGLDEFTSVFAPQNSALATLQQALGKLAVKQGRIWVAAPDADPKLSPEFLNFLNRVSSISDAFFASGGPQAAMKYTLKPVPSPGVQSLTLDIDGEHTGGGQAKQFTWPGAASAQQVDLRVKVGATIPFASYDGLWGVFRMMADGDPRAPGSKAVILSHVRQGHSKPGVVQDASGNPISIRLEMVDMPNGIDVFDRNFFNVRCPGKVTQ